MSDAPVYLDYQATTPIDPRVLRTMVPYMTTAFGNCHSQHIMGRAANTGVEKARAQVASVINASPEEIIFTSGATESNNTAIKGIAHYYADQGKDTVFTTAVEHKCVLESVRALESEGFKTTFLPVTEKGVVDVAALAQALSENKGRVSLVSTMAVNNEVGSVAPLKTIGRLCAQHDVLFHTDGAQAFGKIPIDVRDCGINAMSISGHKIYGPKGVGALFLSRKRGNVYTAEEIKENDKKPTDELQEAYKRILDLNPELGPIPMPVSGRKRLRIVPILSGGGQERGIRSGTLPVFLNIGLGAAAEFAKNDMPMDYKHAKKLYDIVLRRLTTELDDVKLNGHENNRCFNNLNLSFFGVEGESLMLALDKVLCVSSGSACTSASLEPSHVLHAMGVDAEYAHSAVRIGFGRFTTEEDVNRACDAIVAAVRKLRAMSPLYEMKKAGLDIKKIDWNAH